MLKPAVGVVMLGVSSFASCLRIVVLPLLSNPNNTILNSLSDDDLSFLNSDKRPYKTTSFFITSNCKLKLVDFWVTSISTSDKLHMKPILKTNRTQSEFQS